MTHAHVVDDQIAAVGPLPKVGRVDGRTVSGFDRLPADVLAAEGWFEITDGGPPAHDPATHYAAREVVIDGDGVVAVYTIHELPEPEPDPRDERIAVLEDAVDTLILELLFM